jgi:predicted CoA-binding protein
MPHANPPDPELVALLSWASARNASLSDVRERIDIVDVFRKAEDTPPIADEAVKAGAKAFWLQEGISSEDAAARGKAGG